MLFNKTTQYNIHIFDKIKQIQILENNLFVVYGIVFIGIVINLNPFLCPVPYLSFSFLYCVRHLDFQSSRRFN